MAPMKPIILSAFALAAIAGSTFGVMDERTIAVGLKSHNRALHIKDGWMRDPYIVLAPDGVYYLTGTTFQPGDPAESSDPYNLGLGKQSRVGWKAQVWRSRDLIKWEHLGAPFSLQDGIWFKEQPAAFAKVNEKQWRLWAPELHWLGDRWALIHTSPSPVRSSNLSLSPGTAPAGPWSNPMGTNIAHRHDPSLFKDDDGTWWMIWGATEIAPLKPDFSGFAAAPARIGPSGEFSQMGHEGCLMRKLGGKYVLFGTGWSTGRMRRGSYNLYYAVADKITGSYGERKFAGRFLGHGTPFQDQHGRWWCTAFFNANRPPLSSEGIEIRDLSDDAQSINEQGVTIVPLEFHLVEGEVIFRAKDPRYAQPGPDEAQKFVRRDPRPADPGPGPVSVADPATGRQSRPDILLILADDLGWSDLGCYGGEIQTPNLDGLARNGLRFTQFYNTARCCPTRASLLTGLYPHQAGVGSMSQDRGAAQPGYRGTLQPNTVTLAEVLRDAGYGAYMVGKWHLRNNETDVKPTDRGFDEFYGMLGGFNSCWQEHPFYTRWPKERTARSYTSAKDGQPGTFYSTDAFADYALDFIGQARKEKKPFFLYLAFNAPHFPLHAPESDIAKYEAMYFAKGWDAIREARLARQKELGLVSNGLALTPRTSVPPKSHAKPSPYAGKENPAWNSLPEERRRDLARRMAVYAGMVDRMDVAVGRVVNDLRQHGQLDNTLILFLSDNGACWEWDPLGFDVSSGPRNILHTGAALKQVGGPESYISYGSGWANAGNTPWRFYKHFSHEGGIRTPLIVHWPVKLKARGELRREAGHVIDLMPTLVEVAGARYPAERNGVKVQPMEGRSLLPSLDNRPIGRSAPLFFEHEGSRAVREGQWKLVSLPGEAWELYDLQADPTEMSNLIGGEAAKARELIAAWNAWAKRCQVDAGTGRLGGTAQTPAPALGNPGTQATPQ
jgi:arylsulfatase